MSKRTVFTTITPLPSDMSRQNVIDFLHSHLDMIDLNPLVTERHPIAPPPHAGADEKTCIWYSLTDKVDVLGKSNNVSYTCAFNNLPTGLQTHCYAPMGLDIRDRWTVGGSLPGEPSEPVELGLGAPATGLYIREEVEMRCNVFMAGFVKKTLKKSHAVLVEKLKEKANSGRGHLIAQQQASAGTTHFSKPLPVPPNHAPSWSSAYSYQQSGHGPNRHQQPVPTQGPSMAEQWVRQQQQQQLHCQGSMLAQPTLYRVPTIRQSDEPLSAYPEPLRTHRSQGSFVSGVTSALAAVSGPSPSAHAPYAPPTVPVPPQQQGLRPAPSVVRWAGARDKDYTEFSTNPYGAEGPSVGGRQPVVRPGERVVVRAQPYHPANQGQGQGQQGFIAELE
jgi:hypothetical protein